MSFISYVLLAMNSSSMSHYEQQLYSVFKTFDVDNEEAINKCAALELCNALQLEDRGAALVESLFEQHTNKVTFAQFRSGLLTVLGAGGPQSVEDTQTAASPTQPQQISQSIQSDDDSSGREVAPKFVFGSKKYGRRSRPQRHNSATDVLPSPRAASDSRLEANNKRTRHRFKCKRSASLMENRSESTTQLNDTFVTEGLDHGKPIQCEEALALCHSLKMDGIDQHVVKSVFDNSLTKETTVGEFFDRLNASLASSIAAACNSSVVTTHSDIENDWKYNENRSIASENIIEAWESIGVQRPQQLLTELGFTEASVHPRDLEHTLEDEMRTLITPTDDPTIMLLLAALAFSRLQTQHAYTCVELTVAERDKLRNDLAEANRHAQVLAQDVDENHAHIEAELKSSLRLVEARYTDTLRTITAEHAEERERANAVYSQLEAQLIVHSETEVRMRMETAVLKNRNEELEKLISIAETHISEVEQDRAQVIAKLKEIEGQRKESEIAEVVTAELRTQINELQLENKILRDRNDELCAELEGTRRVVVQGIKEVGASWREEVVAAANAGSWQCTQQIDPFIELHEECDSASASIEQKMTRQAEVAARIRALLEVVQTVPMPGANGNCQLCGSLAGIIATVHTQVQELSEAVISPERIKTFAEAAVQTERNEVDEQTDSQLRSELESCRRQLVDADQQHEQDRDRLNNLIKELECSLEELKEEYESCEEYWSAKLEEERSACGAELAAGDERLAQLAQRIHEYERQFRAQLLPPVPERPDLEAQVEHLQSELDQSRVALAAQHEERAALAARLDALQRAPPVPAPSRPVRDYHNPAYAPPAPAPAPAPLPPAQHTKSAMVSVGVGVGEGLSWCGCGGVRAGAGGGAGSGVRARLGAAERALHALQARLVAADLLVKELYIENCHLHHATHL